MKKLLWALVAIITFAGCELDPKLRYYDLPTIENVAISHDLTNVTANDDLQISAKVTSPFGRGFVCVKYWVFTPTWGEQTPEMRIVRKNQELQMKVEPTVEGEEATWKKLASIAHTYIYVCPACGAQTLTKPTTCTACEFKEDKERKFAANNVVIEEGKPFDFEAVIPKQKAGKMVIFTLYCTTEYGIELYSPSTLSEYYTYTVQP